VTIGITNILEGQHFTRPDGFQTVAALPDKAITSLDLVVGSEAS